MEHLTSAELRERAERLQNIAEKMYELWEEADFTIKGTGHYESAKAYTLAHLKIGITNEHGYVTRDTSLMDIANHMIEEADDIDANTEDDHE